MNSKKLFTSIRTKKKKKSHNCFLTDVNGVLKQDTKHMAGIRNKNFASALLVENTEMVLVNPTPILEQKVRQYFDKFDPNK